MKKLLTLFAFAALLCLMPLSAKAETINTVISSENITKTSTVYAGEVVVDGVTKIKYLYSGDISLISMVRQKLLAGLNSMSDGDYAAMLDEHFYDNYYQSQQNHGFAICSDSELVAAMDENWSSAQYVGTLYYPGKSVTSEINSNLYDIDEGFKAVLDSLTTDRMETIDTPADVEKCIVSHLDANANSNVYYTVEDGQIVKHVDTYVEYSAEATTVIYTKVELASGSTSTVLGDVDGDGTVSVTDVAWIVNHILGVNDNNFIAANADINGDGEIDINDVMATVSIILKGEVVNICPDDNHPHMIDLGLPSGTKWACCNVGAEKPEDYGGYYAWGETEEKDVYHWTTYIHCDGSKNTCHDLGSDIAGTQYDVAHVKWGGSWVMPTDEQRKELADNCRQEWTTLNDVNGRKFTSKINGNCIFLPAAGYRYNSGLNNNGGNGSYWTATQYSRYAYQAYSLTFSTSSSGYNALGRDEGNSVRPVAK